MAVVLMEKKKAKTKKQPKKNLGAPDLLTSDLHGPCLFIYIFIYLLLFINTLTLFQINSYIFILYITVIYHECIG